jgi:hypothetical protein
MSAESSRRHRARHVDHIARGDTSRAGTGADVDYHSRAAGGAPSARAESGATRGRYVHRRRALASSSRRLGAVEYALLALIALGVAITIAMAIVNP